MTHQVKFRFPSPWNDKVILTSLAVAQAISLAYSGGVADSIPVQALGIISMIRGTLMGLAVSFGMAKIVQALPKLQGKRRKLAFATVGALFVCSPALVAAAFLAPEWLYHTLAVVASDLAAASVALGAKALSDDGAPSKVEAKPKQATSEPDPLFRCSCGWSSDAKANETRQRAQHNGHRNSRLHRGQK